jgi:hypothetical protein
VICPKVGSHGRWFRLQVLLKASAAANYFFSEERVITHFLLSTFYFWLKEANA